MRGNVRHLSTFAFVIVFAAMTALAQQSGTGSRGGTVRPMPRTNTQPVPNQQQPVFYAGRVMLDTGIAPPMQVAIVRTCNGVSRRETYAAADGSFSFVAGDRNTEVAPEASDDMRTMSTDTPYMRTPANATPGPMQNATTFDCEIRADLAGYSSTSIHLDPTMTNSQVGILMLHSRAKKAEGMVTVASLAVPAKARREFEKGSEQLEKGNLADAEKSLRKAIDEYPKFAEAWTRLGDLEQRRKDVAAAVKDYEQAIDSDPNLPLPYLRLAFLNALASHWEDTRRLTEKLMSLDPTDFPMAYYYNAVAEFNLNHIAKAESSALRADAMDKQHSEPRIQLLLASINVSKENYTTAAEYYRTFLKITPPGQLTDRVKVDLAKIEQLAASKAPASPAAAPPNK
jgi:tetratricopeptide (TPR) repeat protein